jgi:putative membrane protein
MMVFKLQKKLSKTNIKNTNGDEKFSQNGNSLIWDAQKHDIYYQGESENELPISCSVKYELDGEEISAKDIAGKSGKVKVTINYENKSENLVNINGKTQKLYTPFVVVAGTPLCSFMPERETLSPSTGFSVSFPNILSFIYSDFFKI